MEIDTQNIDREIIETREKQQSLHSEKGRDMQDSNQNADIFFRDNISLPRAASNRWSSSLYCPMRRGYSMVFKFHMSPLASVQGLCYIDRV